jgi:hypothetical protein
MSYPSPSLSFVGMDEVARQVLEDRILTRAIDERFATILGRLWRDSQHMSLPKTMALLDQLLDERSAAAIPAGPCRTRQAEPIAGAYTLAPHEHVHDVWPPCAHRRAAGIRRASGLASACGRSGSGSAAG